MLKGKNILLAAQISSALKLALEQAGAHILSFENSYNEKELHGIITSNILPLDKNFLQKCNALEWIARLGSGLELIDTDYCKKNHIQVFSSPAGIANAVAEHIMGGLLSLQKKILLSYDEIKNKQWRREENRGEELENKIVGIIGFGNTGRALAKKLSVFTEHILVYDKKAPIQVPDYVKVVSLQDIQSQADIISFHVPLHDETKNYYNPNFIDACKNHILINTSRGEISPMQSILYAYANKKLKAFILDVFEDEHKLKQAQEDAWEKISILQSLPSVLTPHIAGYSFNAIEKMSKELQTQIFEFVKGKIL